MQGQATAAPSLSSLSSLRKLWSSLPNPVFFVFPIYFVTLLTHKYLAKTQISPNKNEKNIPVS